jgi:hypothetical protein
LTGQKFLHGFETGICRKSTDVPVFCDVKHLFDLPDAGSYGAFGAEADEFS